MLRYLLKLFAIAFFTLPVGVLIVFLAIFDWKGNFVYQLSRVWTWLVLKVSGIHLKVRGLDHLDPRQSYIFMANHQSNMDIPVLVQSLSRFQLRWIAKKELAFVPVFGWALWSSRHILVTRGNQSEARATLRKAKEKLKDGASIMLFPEGTRGASGKLLPFKKGGFLLAFKTKTSVVPVTLNGSGTILPRGDWRIRAGEIEVIIGRPISLEHYRMGTLGELLNQVRGLIESNLTEQGGVPRISDKAVKELRTSPGWVQR